MGRKERARYDNNEKARELLRVSRERPLSEEEIKTLRDAYTGSGGLSTWHNGAFFTPPIVTRFAIDLLGIKGGKVFEPSCGAGAFIQDIPQACEVVGVEQMIETADVARLCNPRATIIQGDTLTMMEQFREQFDFCIGNPPFMKTSMNPEYAGFDVTGKSRKAEWMFIELAFNALKPGGAMAMVVPDGILGNASDQKYREHLMTAGVVRAVVSLPRETFYFTGTTVKCSVIVVQKKVPGVDYGNYPVFMGVAKDIGWDSRGRETGKCDLPKMLAKFQSMYPTRIQPDTVHAVQEATEALSVPAKKPLVAASRPPTVEASAPASAPASLFKLPWEMSSQEWISEIHRVQGTPLEAQLACGVSPEWRRQHIEKGTWVGNILAKLYPDGMEQGVTPKEVVMKALYDGVFVPESVVLEHPGILIGLKKMATHELTIGEYKTLARCGFEQRMAEEGRPFRWYNMPDLTDQALESMHRGYVAQALQDKMPVSVRVLDDYEGIALSPAVEAPEITPIVQVTSRGKRATEGQLTLF